jgi:hypothetical protein
VAEPVWSNQSALIRTDARAARWGGRARAAVPAASRTSTTPAYGSLQASEAPPQTSECVVSGFSRTEAMPERLRLASQQCLLCPPSAGEPS